MQNRIFLTFACPLKWDDLADIDGEVSRRQCEKCQCSVQKVNENNIEQYQAMRDAQPGKRHCVAVKKNKGMPYVSLSEAIKTHLLDRLFPLSFLTKRVISIALSSFLFCGSFIQPSPVMASCKYSRDHSQLFIEPIIEIHMGEGGAPVTANDLAKSLFEHLQSRRLLNYDPDIWQNHAALSYARDYETGIVSKGTVLNMADFLKRKGFLKQASAYYALYLTFDGNSSQLNDGLQKANIEEFGTQKLVYKKTRRTLEFSEAPKTSEGEISAGNGINFLTYPKDLELVEDIGTENPFADDNELMKTPLYAALARYSDLEYQVPAEHRALALGRLLFHLNRHQSIRNLTYARVRAIEVLVELLENQNTTFEFRKICFESLQEGLFKPHFFYLSLGRKQHLPQLIHLLILSFAADSIKTRNKNALVLAENLYAQLFLSSPEFSQAKIPEHLTSTEQSLFDCAIEKEAKILCAEYFPLDKRSTAADCDPNRIYKTLLERAKTCRVKKETSKSIAYIKAAGQFQYLNKASCALGPLLSEIAFLRPAVAINQRELLDFWSSEYSKQ